MFKKIVFTIFLVFFFANPIFARDVEVYFTPSYRALDTIIELIDNSHYSVDVAMYSFTSRPLARALVRAKDRGVSVRVLLDKSGNNPIDNKYTKYNYLISHGISVVFFKPHEKYNIKGILHDKFAIFDDKVVETGSANWTASAFIRNDENILIIRRFDIVNVYRERFNELWMRQEH